MAAIPAPNLYAGPSMGSLADGIPQAEQITVQDEVNQLISQIEMAHDAINAISGSPSAPTNQTTAQFPVGTGVRTARERMGALIERLTDLHRYAGQI